MRFYFLLQQLHHIIPAQDKAHSEINQLKLQTACLIQLKNTGMSTVTTQHIKDIERERESCYLKNKNYTGIA